VAKGSEAQRTGTNLEDVLLGHAAKHCIFGGFLQLARGDKLIEDEIGLCSPAHARTRAHTRTHARTHACNKNPSTRLSGQMITCERTRANGRGHG